MDLSEKILDKKEADKELKEVAQEFESLFLNEMLKWANAEKLAKSILSNDEQETYMSLLNQELVNSKH